MRNKLFQNGYQQFTLHGYITGADLSPSTLDGLCQALCLLKQGHVAIRNGEALSLDGLVS